MAGPLQIFLFPVDKNTYLLNYVDGFQSRSFFKQVCRNIWQKYGSFSPKFWEENFFVKILSDRTNKIIPFLRLSYVARNFMQLLSYQHRENVISVSVPVPYALSK